MMSTQTEFSGLRLTLSPGGFTITVDGHPVWFEYNPHDRVLRGVGEHRFVTVGEAIDYILSVLGANRKG